MFGSLGRRSFANRSTNPANRGATGGWQSRGRGGAQFARTGGRQQQPTQGRKFGQQGGMQRQQYSTNMQKRFVDRVVRPREASVEVHKSWKLVQTIPLAEFNKAKPDAIPEADELGSYGRVEQFDSTLEQITTRTEKPLRKFDQRQVFNVTTSDDPILSDLSAADEGSIFATDTILSVLMAAPRSVYSWDLVAEKTGTSIVWDKRPKSLLDMATVHETGEQKNLNLEDDSSINHPTLLAVETTAVNHNFTQQALHKDRINWAPEDAKESPFVAEAGVEIAPVMYRYRRWELQGGQRVVARTELNGFAQKKGSTDRQLLCIRALNEFDSKATGAIDFRQKLDMQRNAVMATENSNNGCKLARWTAQAMLAGADEMKIGFVTRSAARDAKAHTILAAQRFKVDEMFKQINQDAGRMWATVRRINEIILALPDGKYLLLKDPNDAKLSVYSLPESYSIDDELQGNNSDYE
jgi:translation initiation factor 3 subunit D